MKPLIVLILVFSISVFVLKLTTHKYDFPLSARIAMCAMLFFTAIGHFVYSKGMTMMIPSIIPYKTEIVFLTGVLEIALGIGLLIPSFRIYSAWILILFFIALLPANINAAINNIDYQKGTFDGSGLTYLWFRVPLQILFIVWTYFSSIKF
jgi:uncharacterized membrane protein